MSLSKELISEALRPVGPVLWASACDTYASVRMEMPAGTFDAEFERTGAAAHAAVVAKAAEVGTRVDSFIVEFVDAGGKIVHTGRFGRLNAGAAVKAATAAPARPANSPSQGSPPSQGTSPPPGAAPAQASPPGAGHTPIPGLRPTPQGTAGPLPGVRHIIAVGAGKGGVGKSTIALNLAVGLARKGHAVGVLDGDIYGPSMPTMLGLGALDAVVHAGMLQPFHVHGVKTMTIGKLVDPDKALIWRGPMAHGAFKQLTEQTSWGELDYLIIDLPPGTGDVALTMSQMLRLTGAVIVCTPQKVAQDDAVRATRMFQQLGVDILGVVENMSHFVGDDGKVYDLFGRGGAEMMAQRLGVPFLGAVPITTSLRRNCDSGDPTANFEGKDEAGTRLTTALTDLVSAVEGQVAMASLRTGRSRPTLTIN